MATTGQAEITIAAENLELPAFFRAPDGAETLVVFVHGSGSSRHSPRNQYVAEALNNAGHGTLLFDLLTPEEHEQDTATREHRFDIEMLAERVANVIDWAERDGRTSPYPLVLFGASTGAAAALCAAARRRARVIGVVSRGGRPDLAGDDLERVACPVCLIVGENDPEVLRKNREASTRITAPMRLEVVPGATHLFEERGALDQVIEIASGFVDETRRSPARPELL